MLTKLLVIGITLALIVGGFVGYRVHEESVSKDMQNLAYYKARYLWKSGATQGYGSYQLRSFDGGLNWYAVDTDVESGSVTIKGLAEEVFPGLLAELEGWDRLMDYAIKNGPITLSGNRAAEDLSALTGAGFTVETK